MLYNKINKSVLVVCSILLCCALFIPLQVRAAGAYITASSYTIYVGDTVTFTVGANNAAGYITVSGDVNDYDWFDNSTKTYSVKATSTGTIDVNIQGVVADYNTEKDISVNSSISVKVIQRPSSNQSQSSQQNTQTNLQQGSQTTETDTTSKSNDASLASLQISDGTLSPAFKSGTTNYELSLPSDAESIKIEAKANDSKASVSGAGEISLKQGNNKIEIIVTAEDGTTKTYTINAYVEEKPEVYLNYHDQELGVVKNTDQVSKPSDAFEEVTLEIDGKEVTGWKNNIMEVTVLYMIDEESGEKNFYIYDTESKSITSIFKPVALLGNNLYIIDIDEDLQDRIGMTFTTVTVDEQELPGWTFDEAGFDSYCLIYVMNEQGEKQYYQYETTQNTLQLYSNAAPISTESYEKSQQVEKIAIILAGVFGVTTIAALIGCVVICRRSNLRVRRLVKKENLFEE